MAKRVLVTGGAGYVGSKLVPKMLDAGYELVVLDLFLYGNDIFGTHHGHEALTEIKGDLRDTDVVRTSLEGCDTVIHLACISNDASYELDSSLSKSINFDAFEPLVIESKSAGVTRFIYASTSSVYGVSDAPDVFEDHPLLPLTDYNKYKGLCEPILLKQQSDDFTTVVIRPSTVCGYAKRMRFDLSVNILTNHAVKKGKITVFGGDQKRPNIHIDDINDLYLKLLELPADMIAGETFNAGYENFTINEIAGMVKATVEKEFPDLAPIAIERTGSNDPRSYHVNSDKIRRVLNFVPSRTIEDAVRDICTAFKAGEFPDSLDNTEYFNIQLMKEISLR